jgi:hypothetical protein
MAAGYVALGSGKLYYEIEGKGEILVLCHAGSVDSRMWDGQCDSFTNITGYSALTCVDLGNRILQSDRFLAESIYTACCGNSELSGHIC